MISKRRYMREVTEARRTYRQATEELEARLLAKERQLDVILDRCARATVSRGGSNFGYPTIVIRCDDMLGALPDDPAWLYTRLARRIIESLHNVRRDYRPDMREADNPAHLLRG